MIYGQQAEQNALWHKPVGNDVKEGSEFLKAPNIAIKTRKQARDARRYSEFCGFLASHVTSSALGDRLMKSLMGALGFDFNR